MDRSVSLLTKVKQGDREAFNELYRIHYLSLRSFAGLFLPSDETDDIIQDVFLNVWSHRGRIDEAQSFRGYLMRAVYNTSLNALRKKNLSSLYGSSCRRQIEEAGYMYYDPDANDVIRRMYNRELQERIDQAIDSLPEKCRRVFRLSYINDLPSKEISNRLQISLSTVENHIYSALKQLRLKLSDII